MPTHLVPVPAAGSEGSDRAWLGSERSQWVTISLIEITVTVGARAKIHKRLDSSED